MNASEDPTLWGSHRHNGSEPCHHNLIDYPWVQAAFCVAYTVVFVLGLVGNALVCLVVVRNRAMHTVTNIFITNLALADILLCIFAVPFTPLYTFTGSWHFGALLCRIMPYAQGCSVYISTLTLTSIAIDRFFVIIYPFKPRMKIETCALIVLTIWTFAMCVTLPYAVFMELVTSPDGRIHMCDEAWPTEWIRRTFGTLTSILQFLLPFTVIAFCYTCVSFKLNDRAKSKPATKNSRKEELDRERKRRTNQMLIAMVSIFGASWLPLNAINISNDYYSRTILWEYYFIAFFLAHLLAMSSTCYNPFIYAWMNENFRKEFKQLLPWLNGSAQMRASLLQLNQFALLPSDKTLNGTNTDTDTGTGGIPAQRRRSEAEVSEADLLARSEVRHCHVSTSYNLRRESVKLRLINEESFDAPAVPSPPPF